MLLCPQVASLLDQQTVEPAILLAETIAAVDEVKDPDKAYEVFVD